MICRTTAVSTDRSTAKKHLWGKGRIERIIALKEKISATALMIDVDILSPKQQVSSNPYFLQSLNKSSFISLSYVRFYAKHRNFVYN